jgi:hypothetical protein
MPRSSANVVWAATVDGVIGSETHWSHTMILKSYEGSKRS